MKLKRYISVLIAVAMILSGSPMWALADAGGTDVMVTNTTPLIHTLSPGLTNVSFTVSFTIAASGGRINTVYLRLSDDTNVGLALRVANNNTVDRAGAGRGALLHSGSWAALSIFDARSDAELTARFPSLNLTTSTSNTVEVIADITPEGQLTYSVKINNVAVGTGGSVSLAPGTTVVSAHVRSDNANSVITVSSWSLHNTASGGNDCPCDTDACISCCGDNPPHLCRETGCANPDCCDCHETDVDLCPVCCTGPGGCEKTECAVCNPPVPNAPTDPSANAAADGEVTVSWAAPADGPDPTGYAITATPQGGDAITKTHGTTAPLEVKFNAEGTPELLNGVTYDIAIVALIGDTPSATAASGIVAPTLAAVTGFNATDDLVGSVKLDWTALDGATGYRIYRKLQIDADTEYALVTDITNPATVTYTNTIATGEYTYRIIPYNKAGDSAAAHATTDGESLPASVAPPAPANLKAVSGNGQVVLTWDAADTAIDYFIYQDNSQIADGVTALTYTVTGLTNDQEYTFEVAARNDAGTGARSAPATATPEETDNPLGVTVASWFESAQLAWNPAGYDSFNVYFKAEGTDDSAYVLITDNTNVHGSVAGAVVGRHGIVRNGSADLMGLKGGVTYDVRVVGVNGVTPDYGNASVVQISPEVFDRTGYAFSPQSRFGATTGGYQADGTPHPNTVIIYVTHENMNTFTNPFNAETGIGGVFRSGGRAANAPSGPTQANTRPVIVRFAGQIGSGDRVAGSRPGGIHLTNRQLPSGLTGTGHVSSDEGSMLRVQDTFNVTFEGVGSDAIIYGWGLFIRNSENIEIRNLTFDMYPDDAVFLQGGSSAAYIHDQSLPAFKHNLWVHHNRFHFGSNRQGAAADQVKGDGSVDIGDGATFFTISYNHFIETDKTGLINGSDGRPFVRGSFHHNFYENSGSRHPRVRVGQMHIFNNYFSGVRTYAIGAADFANVIAEGNYFENTNRPMIIRGQGSENDTLGGAPGAIVTSLVDGFNHLVPNHMDAASLRTFVAADNAAVVTNSRGSHTFGHVGTAQTPVPMDPAGFYSYTVSSAQNARERVLDYAGPMQKFEPPAAPQAPDAPVAVITDDNYISISWGRVHNAESYTLRWDQGTGIWDDLVTTASTSFTTTETASPNFTYEFTVTAINNEGSSAPSAIGSVTFAAPGAPTALNVDVIPGGLEISWTAPIPAPSRYEVTLTPQAGGDAIVVSTTDTGIMADGLASGIYNVSVRAIRGDLYSAPVTQISGAVTALIQRSDLTHPVWEEAFESMPVGAVRDSAVMGLLGLTISNANPNNIDRAAIGSGFPPTGTMQDAFILDDDGNRVLRLQDNSGGGSDGENGQAIFMFIDLPEVIAEGRVVIEYDFWFERTTTGTTMVPLRLLDGSGNQLLSRTSANLETTSNNRWISIEVVADFDTRRADIYLDGEILQANQELAGTGGLKTISANTQTGQQSSGASQMALRFDNFSVRIIDDSGNGNDECDECGDPHCDGTCGDDDECDECGDPHCDGTCGDDDSGNGNDNNNNGGNNDSDDSGSDSGGGTGGGAIAGATTTTARTTQSLITVDNTTTQTINSALTTAIANAAAAGTVTPRFENIGEVSAAVLAAIDNAAGNRNVIIHFDTMLPGQNAVDVRVYIDPSTITAGSVNVSGSTTNAAAQSTKSIFETFFTNNIAIVSLGQQGSFGADVRVAARVDLTGMDTGNLHFYSYDSATNIYTRILNPRHRIDANGYLHFTTPIGGNIVVSSGPLALRNAPA